jgi:Arc/MetJ-type ribon-helix-helix transcriptional regulator
MEMKELPAELASFVEHALASGTYPSAEALVADAVRMLRDQEAEHTARPHTPDAPAHPDVATSPPEDLVQAIRQALATGEARRARQRALEGAQRYPAHAVLQHYARVLAPPTTQVVPASPASRASVKANGAWLHTHRTAYAGRWVALRDGALVRDADSLEALVAAVGDTTGLLLTRVV